MGTQWNVGDKIEVVDQQVCRYPFRGIITELDLHPLADSFAKIVVDSVALPAPEKWVNLRLARKAPR